MSDIIPKGIKAPPIDLRSTIDKTVGYVLKNGTSFEERLRSNNDNKFEFLNEENEFYQYYKWKLTGKIEGEVDETGRDFKPSSSNKEIPKPRDLKFLTHLPTISSLDLDIIKLTALFVAKNGPDYIPQLIHHQKRLNNQAQFEFLNKDHSLNKLFLNYVNQYSIVFKFYKSEDSQDVKELNETLMHSDNALINSYRRAQYNKQHKFNLQNEKKIKEQKQLHYASINWQDFSIVGKIEFDAVDQVKELSIPLSRDDLIYRSLESKRKEVELPKFEPSSKSKEEQVSNKKLVQPKGMKIKAAGESRLKSRARPGEATINEPTIKCPLTGKLIPESKFDNHLRVLLRDPRYKEEQDNFLRKNFKYASNLTTDEVYNNIKRLAKKREGSPINNENKKTQIGPN